MGKTRDLFKSPLDCKEIQLVHPKGDQSWVFIGRTDVEAETPILWPPDVKNWLIWKDPDAGKDWRQEEKGTTEDEMVGWHQWLEGHEFGQALGVGDGQGSLVCCSPWGRKELDTTEWLKWLTEVRVHQSPQCPHSRTFQRPQHPKMIQSDTIWRQNNQTYFEGDSASKGITLYDYLGFWVIEGLQKKHLCHECLCGLPLCESDNSQHFLLCLDPRV